MPPQSDIFKIYEIRYCYHHNTCNSFPIIAQAFSVHALQPVFAV